MRANTSPFLVDTLEYSSIIAVVHNPESRYGSCLKMISKAATSSNHLERLAELGILIPNVSEVQAYLVRYPQLAQLLPGVCAGISEELTADTELSLELYADPETDDRYLTLYARKHTYEANFLYRLQEVSERFFDCLEGIPGYILLTTDFSGPRGRHAL